MFLHAVEEGPANRSYGLQVAQLAGVPGTRHPRCARAALDRARRAGLRRERRSAISSRPTLPAPERTGEHPALELLRSIDPDALTPREALELLYQLRQKLDE